MKIVPEPIFFELLKVQTGIKKGLIHIINQSDEDFSKKITDIKAPAWIEFEKIRIGDIVNIKKRSKTPYVVRVDTAHKLFADEIDDNNGIEIELGENFSLNIAIVVEEVIKEIPDYKGTFSIDFGTTNSCYAYRSRVGEESDISSASQKAKTSDIIPSVIFFKNVDKTHPEFEIGNTALFDIEENSSQTYSYFRSIKRFLGSDRLFTVLDKFSGLKPERRQRWNAQDISAYYLSSLIHEAEIELGSNIRRVIATYPVLFTKNQKNALKNAYIKAFDYLGRDIKKDAIILNLDESTAASFNYIYGPLLDEFRVYEKKESHNKLLTFDFGGGTIDVSLVDVNIQRQEDRRVQATLKVEGITGARHYGGDNVTLEVFKILKNRLALTIAQELYSETEEKDTVEEEEEEKKEEADIFSGESEEEDFWSVEEEDEVEEETEEEINEEVLEEDEFSEIVNTTEESVFNEALKCIVEHSEAIESTIKDNIAFDQAILDQADDEKSLTATMARKKAEEIDKSIEMICPTKYAHYRDEDPIKAKVARILFHEIWSEADRMKVRASVSPDGIGELGMEMKKIAKYAGVEDYSIFNRVIKISMEEVENKIRGDIATHIKKSRELYNSTKSSSYGSIEVEDKADNTTEDLTIILSGNSSRLALVKKLFKEIFDVTDDKIRMDDASIKKDVSQGACEEFTLKKEFGGEEGLISFKTEGFLDRIPFTIGLYQKDLTLAGYENGFCPLISRGSKLPAEIEISDDNPLIHRGMETLPVYADYHDGGEPFYIGWFDLSGDSGSTDTGSRTVSPDNGSFVIKLSISENRDLEITEQDTGRVFSFIEKEDAPTPQENPFSGIY